MGITKLSMNRVIWNQFGVMRQERLLPEQQELLHNKSPKNTRWKLIPSYFVIQACWTKWKQPPRSLVCMRTSVDVMCIFIQGRAGSWQLWLVNVCEHCWPEHLSQQRCGAAAFCFCRVACLTFQQLLFSDSSWQPSLSHFHIHSYHFLQLVDLICESESRFSVHRVLF